MNESLLVSFPAAPRESPRSYLRRLARANGCEHFVAPELSTLDAAMAFYPKFSKLLLPEHRAASAHTSLAYSGSGYREASLFFGHRIYPIRLRKSGRPYCAACLSEGKDVVPLAWELKEAKVCIVHGCLLQDRCPSCDGLVKWTGRTGDRCSCGFELNASDRQRSATSSWVLEQLIERAFYRETNKPIIFADGLFECACEIDFGWLLQLAAVYKNIVLPHWFKLYWNKNIASVDPAKIDEILLELLDDSVLAKSVKRIIRKKMTPDPTQPNEDRLVGLPWSEVEERCGTALRRLPIQINLDAFVREDRHCWWSSKPCDFFFCGRHCYAELRSAS